MGLPPVRLRSSTSRTIQESQIADTVIGVDVSGSFGDPNTHVVTAVRVRRSDADQLLERLFEIDMLPWLGKWSQFKHAVHEPYSRIAQLAETLSNDPFSWYALWYEGEQSSTQIATAIGIATGRAISMGAASGTGRTKRGVLIYDGGQDMLGKRQRKLRQQATESFNKSFVDTHHEMAIASLVKADEKYPEVAAADLLGGYIRETLADDRAIPKTIRGRCDEIRTISSPPRREPTYDLFRLSGPQFRSSSKVEARIVAWLRGVAPDSDVDWTPSRFEDIIDQEVNSEQIRTKIKQLPRISPESP